ncbi:MAG: PRC-barrel domain-containing protein [Pseudomonadota bacterium]|nr:PRC-barrel domain-containing protein [Pseudomonadota bacterium]
MMKKLLSSAAVVALLAGGAIAAETSDKASTTMPQTASGVEFVNAQGSAELVSSNIVGASVRNPKGETLGEVNNIIVSKSGSIETVVIGVGGFLGIGEKDVGVRFASLQIKPQSEAPAAKAPAAKEPKEVVRAPANEKPGMTGQAPTPATPSTPSTSTAQRPATPLGSGSQAQPNQTASDRNENIVVVLNATKEQLESAPEYRFLGEQDTKQTQK